jgi:hypothetical protein
VSEQSRQRVFAKHAFCLICYSMCSHTVDLTPLSKLSTHRNQNADMVVRANGNRNSDTTDVTDIELINVTQRKRRAVLQQGTAAKVIGKRVFLGAGKTFYIIEGAPVTPGMLKRIEAMRAANKRANSSTNASVLVPAVVVPTVVFILRLCGCCL